MAHTKHPAAEIIDGLTKPGLSLTISQRWEAGVACEAAKEMLHRGVRDLVRDAHGFPSLSSKSCDGTPLKIVHRARHQLPSGQAVRTSGRQGTEWLVQSQFVRARTPAGDWVTRALLTEPILLQYGKSVPAILGAAFKGWRRLRGLGH